MYEDSDNPRVHVGANGPPIEDDRSKTDMAMDAAAAAIHGALLGVEAEFDCDMSISGEVFRRAIIRYLNDVRSLGGEKAAHAYATAFKRSMDNFLAGDDHE